MTSSRQYRLKPKLEKLLLETKVKNKLPTFADAGEHIAEYLNGIKGKKKVKERIIREIEF